MPLFDFRCPNCGATVEHYIPPESERIVRCPNGCLEPMNRLPGFFHFKGFPRIPRNHLPKAKGGAFDKNDSYEQGMGSRHK